MTGRLPAWARVGHSYLAVVGTKAAAFRGGFCSPEAIFPDIDPWKSSVGSKRAQQQDWVNTGRGRLIPPSLPPLWLPPSWTSLFIPVCWGSLCCGSYLERLNGTMECFARCNFKGHISHCATIEMQRVRRSLYFFAIQLLKCAEIHFICCDCQQLAVSYHSNRSWGTEQVCYTLYGV